MKQTRITNTRKKLAIIQQQKAAWKRLQKKEFSGVVTIMIFARTKHKKLKSIIPYTIAAMKKTATEQEIWEVSRSSYWSLALFRFCNYVHNLWINNIAIVYRFNLLLLCKNFVEKIWVRWRCFYNVYAYSVNISV